MPPRPSSKPKILIVLHQETSSPGRVGHMLLEEGFDLDIRRPPLGDSLPETLEGHAGAVVFGGPMSANDPDDFVKAEIDWIAVPLKENKPYLGLCLGAQMMAKHLGASVWAHPEGRAEIGYYPLLPTAAGNALSEDWGVPWPSHVYHWHREGFDCPAGAETLATGDDFPTQAIQAGRKAFGLQFHPEVTHAMMCRWTVMAEERLRMPGAQDRIRQLAGRFQHDPHVSRWLDRFLDHWLDEKR